MIFHKTQGICRVPLLISAIISVMLISGCGTKKANISISAEDNPLHHYIQGMEAAEKDQDGIAKSKFERSLTLDPEFAPSLAGKALILAKRSAKQTEMAHRKVDAEAALRLLSKANDHADKNEEKYMVKVTAIRIMTQARLKDWLEEAEDNFKDAIDIEPLNESKLPYYQNKDAAHFFMGFAWQRAYNFRKAEVEFSNVLQSRGSGKWQPFANKFYTKLQRIIRASANHTLTDVAAKIAVKEQVVRADVAALLADELKLDKLFAGRIPVKSKEKSAEYTPADILKHPFRHEILTMMKWDVRGLDPVYDNSTRAWMFRPMAPISRKELALALEDVLIKLTGNEKLATAMIGTENSPYPDVQPQSAWFNSIMTSTSRGLMEADLSGEFRPDAPADGAELLLAVFKLRHVLNIH
jgi:hypothetical protein